MRSLREDELTKLAMGWQLPYMSFGEEIKSMATELLAVRASVEVEAARAIARQGRSAREDYPVLAGFDYCAAALDEIDALRVDKDVDAATIANLTFLFTDATERLAMATGHRYDAEAE